MLFWYFQFYTPILKIFLDIIFNSKKQIELMHTIIARIFNDLRLIIIENKLFKNVIPNVNNNIIQINNDVLIPCDT